MKKLLLSTAAVLVAGAMSPRGLRRRKTFALVPKLIGAPFYAEVERGCQAEAAKIGVKCLFTGSSEADEAQQNRVLRDLITKGVDGLAIAPNNGASIVPVIAEAKAKGIPVITFDFDAPKSERSLFVGTNNIQGGVEAGKAFAAALPDGGKYAIITGGLAAELERPHQGLPLGAQQQVHRGFGARRRPATTTSAGRSRSSRTFWSGPPTLRGVLLRRLADVRLRGVRGRSRAGMATSSWASW